MVLHSARGAPQYTTATAAAAADPTAAAPTAAADLAWLRLRDGGHGL